MTKAAGHWQGKRGSAHERGYGAAWVRLRKRIMERDCWLCQVCRREGRLTPATECDHVVPKAEGGTDDAGNLQAICKPCHAVKSAAEGAKAQGRRVKARVTIGEDGWPTEAPTEGGAKARPEWFKPAHVPLHIVCGPPGSGKSTYVRNNAQPHDLLISFDEIAERVLGRPRLNQPGDDDRVFDILRVRNEMLGNLMRPAAARSWTGAWLIVSEPKAEHRQWWDERVRPAEIVVLETPADECKRRVASDEADGDRRPDGIGAVIDQWWKDYAHRPGDRRVVWP